MHRRVGGLLSGWLVPTIATPRSEGVAALTELYPDPSERVQALEDILQQATDAGIKISSSLRILSAFCEDERFPPDTVSPLTGE